MSSPLSREYLRVTEFASVTGLSTKTVKRLVAAGSIASIKVGRSRLIPYAELANLGQPSGNDAA
jgi:excisionase family DNA binding protein